MDLEAVDFALQPIINIHSGRYFGCEAFIRNTDQLGFASIPAFFDAIYEKPNFLELTGRVWERALQKFQEVPLEDKGKLCLNLASRIIEHEQEILNITRDLSRRYQIPPDSLGFEISEKRSMRTVDELKNIITGYSSQGYRVILEHFGTDSSDFNILFHYHPDYLKLDRAFISNIVHDERRKIVAANIIRLSNALGIKVIATGIESGDEFLLCREIGCDLLQGYYIQDPTTRVGEIRGDYKRVFQAIAFDDDRLDTRIIDRHMEFIEPIYQDTDITDVLDKFRDNQERTFFPVVDHNDMPVGLIVEDRARTWKPATKTATRP